MGLGVHGGGTGVAKFFAEIGAQVVVTDLKSSHELRSSLSQLSSYKNIQYVLGKHQEKDFQKADLIIKNPSVPNNSKFLKIAKENKIPIDTDVGIFFNLSPAPIIGVSGTKGKSTTASLIAELLKPHFSTVLAGNIRISVLEVLPKIKFNHRVVLELSSWQLEGLDQHQKSPKIAVITNIDQDHLDRYPSFEAYKEAEKIIFKYQAPEDLLILNANCPNSLKFAKESKSKILFYGKNSTSNADIKDNWFVWQKEKIAHLKTFKLFGDHNLQNALAAITAAKLLNISNESIKKSLEKFKGLSGRLEIVKQINGVTFINDTTATAPAATLKAIRSISRPIILIGGGTDKNLSYKKLVKVIQNQVKAFILLPGSATEKIKKDFSKKITWHEVKNMPEAVASAWKLAEKEDVILLSPAAASFGLFANEFERGDAFVAAVNQIRRFNFCI